MKYIDAEKLKAEIERLKGRLIHGACAAQIEMETNCKDEAYNEVLSCIDYLQQEQPFASKTMEEKDRIDEGFTQFIQKKQEQSGVDLENYISNKLRELGADLINHKPYSFNRGLNVGETNAYRDILDRINARKEK